MSKLKIVIVNLSAILVACIFVYATVLVDMKLDPRVSVASELVRYLLSMVIFYWCKYFSGKTYDLIASMLKRD